VGNTATNKNGTGKVPANFHGVKGRSGRKPRPITVLKRQLAEDRKDDAVYAYSLFVAVMRDEKELRRVRLDCAREVMDRVLGKPHQSFTLGELNDEDIAKAVGPILARLGVELIPPNGARVEDSASQPAASDTTQ